MVCAKSAHTTLVFLRYSMEKTIDNYALATLILRSIIGASEVNEISNLSMLCIFSQNYSRAHYRQ
ncbi:hypothetical protein BC643_1181 [Mangrovibacterium diazotrophicum]|uniref:Uncharacterized protein n=1 Tax=Mangrovibacterium diazotrophicum TaxID=1261403 RepID=A0A419W5W4_9BACT|nr:hypothetical protein BC643_1181 [Mangrovibacterium diazotrophicum]